MLRDGDSPERQIEKLKRINAALIDRLDRADASRGSHWMLFQTAAVLEQELLARNRDLEQALSHLELTNRELALARETADEANRSKSRFLRAASHDLLQPLSAAKLFLSHLSETLSDPLQSDLVARIGTAFDSTEELIRALLEISRLDSVRLDVSCERVSLGRLFQRLAVDFQGAAEARGLDLRFVISSATVMSNPVFLRRIAQNLVSNAIKYTASGRVLVGARRQGADVWLEVHDTGPGIAVEDRERIFNEFERLAPDGEEPGTGLGLSIVRRACLRLGHDIDLRSEPGRGSVFRIRLPRALEAPGALAAGPDPASATGAVQRLAGSGAEPVMLAEPTASAPPVQLAGRRVLVVENDAAMREAYALLLRRWGVEVATADGTGTALAALERLPPEAVVTDYRLERGETGLQTIAALRRRLGQRLPALVVTAEPDPQLQARVDRLGAALLRKPVTEAELRRTLSALLEGRRRGAAAAE
ncbi:hybrid sensor histidine kinase/response regulator [Rhodobacter sp. CZR27]|uniref:ATP-binding response regulator n=1 Tax=Rhodobacter sp. CZR27 TaxID=2033869 RepID=UPI000BBEF9B9|nr:hybrid sensor histidine kinase/response regulator [Rhodobacter sp. CZR27]